MSTRLFPVLLLLIAVGCTTSGLAPKGDTDTLDTDVPTTDTDVPTPPPTDTDDPGPAGPDADGDGVPDDQDECPGGDDTVDTDGDGVANDCDPCPADNPDDTDGDGLCDTVDPCPLDAANDTDGDGVCDADDPCPLDFTDDSDGDGVCNSDDPCPFDNPDDSDGDGLCDFDDPCPLDNPDDSDGDGVCDSDDLCPGQDDAACDLDGDGYSPLDGDCCETVADCGVPEAVNPGAVEAPTGAMAFPVDDDCDGQIDEVDPACDGALAIDDIDPWSAVSAIGICDLTHVSAATYVRANGTAVADPGLTAGLMTGFGPNVDPREGSSMLVLSSGRARTPTDPSPCPNESCATFGPGVAPAGFPQNVPTCPTGTAIGDDVGLELTLTAPTNATGYTFRFRFYSYEYPEYVCSLYNDQYITLVDPAPQGSINGNISFDAQSNPVSVNIAFFDTCVGCPAGTTELVGTGFDLYNDAGATSWLQTTAPVDPGTTFTIRFAIWDTGDDNLDSTVLIDDFEWILEGSPGVETVSDQ